MFDFVFSIITFEISVNFDACSEDSPYQDLLLNY